MSDCPIPGCTEVIHLGGQLGEHLSLRRTSQASVCLAEKHQVITTMTRLGRGLFFRVFREVFLCKLPDEP